MAKNRHGRTGPQRVPSRAEQPAHEDIALLAYQLWEEGGCREGCHEEDWLRAERLLRERASERETPLAATA